MDADLAAPASSPEAYSSSSPEAYSRSPRTTPTRKRDRVRYDRASVHAVLDEALICHVGTVVDGEPLVLPTLHARVGERLYLHASSGSRLAAAARRAPVPVCVTVTLLDGLVLARSQLHHSMNYRSAVVRGEAVLVTDEEEARQALTATVDHVVPGRAALTRSPDARELAATAVLAVDLQEVSLKQRAAGVSDDEADLARPVWAGVVPVVLRYGTPEPDGAAAVSDDLPGRPEPRGTRG